MARKKSFKSFLTDVMNPYLEARNIGRGRVVKMNFAFDVHNIKDSDKYSYDSDTIEKLSKFGDVAFSMFIDDIDMEALHKKYDGGLKKSYAKLIDEDTLEAQEELNLKLYRTSIKGKFFKNIQDLSSSYEDLNYIFSNKLVDRSVELFLYNLILPNRGKVTCNPKYDNFFDQFAHGTKEYTSVARTMLLKEPGNNFRYNLDFIDIRRWAVEEGIDTSKYKVIDASEAELESLIKDRNENIFKSTELEHIKPLTPNIDLVSPKLIDASNKSGAFDEPDTGARVSVKVHISVI